MMSKQPEATLGALVHDLSRLLRRRFVLRAREERLALTRAQCTVLWHLSHQEGSSQAALAQRMDIEPITLARLLYKLEALGLLERQRDPNDRRAHILHLTAEAEPILEQIYSLSERVGDEAQAGLSEIDRQRLLTLLRHVKGNLTGPPAAAAKEDEATEGLGGIARRHHG